MSDTTTADRYPLFDAGGGPHFPTAWPEGSAPACYDCRTPWPCEPARDLGEPAPAHESSG